LALYSQSIKGNIEQIQTLQNELLYVIANKDFMYSTTKLHNVLKILKVKELVIQDILTFDSNFKNDKLPIVLHTYLTLRHTNHSIQTRKKLLTLWNQLPSSLSTLTDTKKLRKKWKEKWLSYHKGKYWKIDLSSSGKNYVERPPGRQGELLILVTVHGTVKLSKNHDKHIITCYYH